MKTILKLETKKIKVIKNNNNNSYYNQYLDTQILSSSVNLGTNSSDEQTSSARLDKSTT